MIANMDKGLKLKTEFEERKELESGNFIYNTLHDKIFHVQILPFFFDTPPIFVAIKARLFINFMKRIRQGIQGDIRKNRTLVSFL